MGPDLMTVTELAELLRVKVSWVYFQCEAGSIPFRKCGHYLRFSRKEIDDWLEEQPGRPAAPKATADRVTAA